MQDHIINDQIADLARAMLELDNMDEAYRFFEDIFTIHELQAVAQRLAVARLLQKKSLTRAGQGNKTQFFCDVLQPSRPLWTAVKGHAFSCRGEFTTKRSPCQGQKATFFVFCSRLS